jgi:hypothetical protein
MGLRFATIGMLVLAGAVWTVWPSPDVPDAPDAPVVVAQLRDAHVPAIVRQVRAAAVELELDPELPADPELEVGEPGAQPALDDDDGLTDEERWEGQVVEVEDRLSSHRGALLGVVRDAGTSERLAGVTVVATMSGLERAQVVITDEHGFYTIDDLPPGEYVVTFYYADVTVERSGVQVTSRAATSVMQTLWQSLQPVRPFVLTLDEAEVSSTISLTGPKSFHSNCGGDIDVTGLTFGDDE